MVTAVLGTPGIPLAAHRCNPRPKMTPDDTLFLIRCGQTSAVAQRLAASLAAATGRPPVFVCDERRGPVSTSGCPKITLSETLLDGLGLAHRPQNWGWFCGDFCYYAAAQAFPDHSHYCLVDSDVFMTVSAAIGLADLFATSPQQALAVRLGEQAEIPRYSRGLQPLGLPPNLGCIFPLSRVHGRVIPKMLELRRKALAGPPPNDEAILAGAVVLGGFSAAALDKIAPSVFGPGNFETNPPHLYEGISTNPDDLRIYHPVVTADEVVARLASGEKSYTRHRLRKVLRQAPPDIAVKIGAALRLAETEQRASL